jgi:hypothetical protein
MVDLWQAIVLLAAGTLLALASGYVQRWWSKSDTLEAEERQATRRHQEEEREALRRTEEEKRQATRQYRRERVRAILDFLELAKKYQAREATKHHIEGFYERNVDGVKEKLSLEHFRKSIIGQDATLSGPQFYQLTHAMIMAVASSPTFDMAERVTKVYGSAGEHVGEQWSSIQSLEELLEEYVTKV